MHFFCKDFGEEMGTGGAEHGTGGAEPAPPTACEQRAAKFDHGPFGASSSLSLSSLSLSRRPAKFILKMSEEGGYTSSSGGRCERDHGGGENCIPVREPSSH